MIMLSLQDPKNIEKERKKIILDKGVEKSNHFGLKVNCQKTECLVMSKSKANLKNNLQIGKNTIKQVEKFSNLGFWMRSRYEKKNWLG